MTPPMNDKMLRLAKQVVEDDPTLGWTWQMLNDRIWSAMVAENDVDDTTNYRTRRLSYTRTELRAFLRYQPFERHTESNRFLIAPGFRRSVKRTVYLWKGLWNETAEEEE